MSDGKPPRPYAVASESRPDVWHVITAKWSMNVGVGASGSASAKQLAGLLNEAHLDGIKKGTFAQLKKRIERKKSV